MPVGKSLRFEIFARDGFVCQYCGTRPPDVVLEVDHIHPVSKGGGDDPINLITSCFDCNRGKRAKVISDIAPRPDADLALLKAQQEMVEARRYLDAKKMRDAAFLSVADSLRDTWSQCLTEETVPTDRVLINWISKYGAEEVEVSIRAAIPAYMRNQFGYGNGQFNNLLKYVGAVLRNRAEETGATA